MLCQQTENIIIAITKKITRRESNLQLACAVGSRTVTRVKITKNCVACEVHHSERILIRKMTVSESNNNMETESLFEKISVAEAINKAQQKQTLLIICVQGMLRLKKKKKDNKTYTFR